MRKILKYEFKKLFSNKAVIVSIIILSIISIFGFYNSQSKYNDILIENLDRYNELEKNYKSDQKALENLKKDLENYIMIYFMYIEDDSNFIMPSDEDKKI